MPKLSVIIAAFNNSSLLKQCLTSLEGQWEQEDTEVFVATNYQNGVKIFLKNNFLK
jgi:glycosyltransferase involved in cell wall biosynthesis